LNGVNRKRLIDPPAGCDLLRGTSVAKQGRAGLWEEPSMRLFTVAFALLAGTAGAVAQQQPAQQPQQPPAQQPQAPTFATTKVEGTDNVYIFRYQSHQAMFVVTPKGVIATDPISYGRPQAATTYVDEIRKVTKAPIKYLVYSHHHYDHIAGGKPFKEAGAKVVAHKRAKERLAQLKGLDVVVPDETVDKKRTLKLGGTTLELHYTGRNHSDSSLVMFLPKEKIIFAVDFNSLGAVPSRLAVNDSYPIEWEASLKKTLALDWDRMIPGHPGPGGRLGTKKDMEQQIAFMSELSGEVKKASDAGKCFSPADAELKLPQYATLTGYEQNLAWNVHRWCGYWGRGI
jgi:glyoxylase-like metal-dependent hydrolase (beta-lactamase superfamily II)